MRIALIGHGRMGRLVERAARDAGIEVGPLLNGRSNEGGRGITAAEFAETDVAVDFSRPECVVDNIQRLVQIGVDLVVGTTGWYDRLGEVRQAVEAAGTGLIFGPNFSIGANLLFVLLEQATDLFAEFEEYEPYLVEVHHKFKVDSPSGTARSLLATLQRAYPGRSIPTAVLQVGHTSGEHEIGFDSPSDRFYLRHEARNRDGYAEGALRAARWINRRSGVHRFRDMLRDEWPRVFGSG